MLPILRPDSLPDTDNSLYLPDSGLSLATLILGAPGTGKTTLESLLALQWLLKGYGQVILDPTGTLSAALIFRLLRFLAPFPPEEHGLLWQRVRYVPVGAKDFVVPFPIYYGLESGQSLWQVAERFLNVLRLSHPKLVTDAPVTWPSIHRIGSNAGMVLAALGYQLTEVEDLLFNTSEWEKSGRFEEAIKRCPESAPAVSYFRNHYLPLSRTDKHRLTSTFLDHVFALSANPQHRLLFGASTQGLDWEESLEQLGQAVILDLHRLSDPETRRFALLWIFQNLYEHIKQRGRRNKPLGLIIDEFASLTTKVAEGLNPLSVLLDELLQQYCRNNRIFFTYAFQSIDQIDDQLRNTVFRLGTIAAGRAGTMAEARVLADLLVRSDVFRVKHYRKVWASEPLFGSGGRVGSSHFVIDLEPQFMGLSDQLELAAQTIVSLPRFGFLCRPATMEGEVSSSVFRISIAHVDQNPETGEHVFPDYDLVSRVQTRLAAMSGIPAATILAEQEARLLQGTPRKPGTAQTAAEARGRQPSSLPEKGELPDPALPALHNAMETHSRPTLDDQQQALLAFLIEHPDMPVSLVYKRVGVSVRKGTDIRERLKQQGFLLELELRSGKAGAGRPRKCIMPSFQAFEQLGIALPKGRGSVIHRHIQQLVAEGARAKGYSTQVEKTLANGTIVDVHLEKGQEKIAVEIAIASRPELELSHFRNCLSFGYDQVYAIFADGDLLKRTAQAIGEAFSEDVAGRVRLLPVSKISHLGR